MAFNEKIINDGAIYRGTRSSDFALSDC